VHKKSSLLGQSVFPGAPTAAFCLLLPSGEHRRFDSYKKFRLDEHRRFDSYKKFRLDEHRRFDSRPYNPLLGLLRRKIGFVCSNRTAILVESYSVCTQAQDKCVFYCSIAAVAACEKAVIVCAHYSFGKLD